MSNKISIFLTFPGTSEEAMEFYQEVFPNALLKSIVRYGALAANVADQSKVLHGELSIKETIIMFLDMVDASSPQFTWATSIYVACDDEEEFDLIFSKLSESGQVMMGPEAVGALRKVAWVTDKYGVTWQPVWA